MGAAFAAPIEFHGIVDEIALHQNDGGALIAGAGGQVAQRTDQVGQTAGSGALGGHGTGHIALFTDPLLDSLLQCLAGEIRKVVVSQVLQLQLVGSAFQTGGVGHGNAGVS